MRIFFFFSIFGLVTFLFHNFALSTQKSAIEWFLYFFFQFSSLKKCKFISFYFHRTKTNMGFNPHPDPLFVTRHGIKPIMSLLSCVSIFSFVESKKKSWKEVSIELNISLVKAFSDRSKQSSNDCKSFNDKRISAVSIH